MLMTCNLFSISVLQDLHGGCSSIVADVLSVVGKLFMFVLYLDNPQVVSCLLKFWFAYNFIRSLFLFVRLFKSITYQMNIPVMYVWFWNVGNIYESLCDMFWIGYFFSTIVFWWLILFISPFPAFFRLEGNVWFTQNLLKISPWTAPIQKFRSNAFWICNVWWRKFRWISYNIYFDNPPKICITYSFKITVITTGDTVCRESTQKVSVQTLRNM